jgi:hypothetical protein
MERRRIGKFLTRPALALRDYLLKRYPLELDIDINRVTKHDRPAPKIKAPTRIAEYHGFIRPGFPVDVVYTWVDSGDPVFQRLLQAHLDPNAGYVPNAISPARFESRDELRYSLRSIETYAPWVRKIFIVTNGQIPSWLDLGHPKIQLVRHDDIIPREYLPTFNSHVIESCLHRIPGLAEHYVYFNDDVMLLRPMEVTDFFTENGLAYAFRTRGVLPDGPGRPSDTPSIRAAKNTRDLIFREWGCYLRLRFAHTFHPQRKSVAAENEERFAEAFHVCRQNKFRAETDLVCCSFLHPCAAYITGRSLISQTRAWFFNIRSPKSINYYRLLLKMKGREDAPYSLCLNDSAIERCQDFAYADAMRAFLEEYYPKPSSFEREAMAAPSREFASH